MRTVGKGDDHSGRQRVDYWWWMGWRPLVVITALTFAGFAVGNAVAVPAGYFTGDLLGSWALLTLCGFFLGVGMWIWGTRTINERYEEYLSTFLDASHNGATRGTGVEATAPDTETTWTLMTGTGSKPLVDAHEHYTVVHFVFGDHLYIYETDFDMTERRGGAVRTVELPYDRIDAVRASTNRPALTITTSDAETFSYETDPERTDVLRGLADAVSGVTS